jgi:predicted nucleotidyltransferase
LVDRAAAERAILEREDPELPELSGPFDPHELAREAAEELRGLYGDRSRQVLLFGSWARGDAHPESDIDLLVVLDEVKAVWGELRRMDSILWPLSLDNDTVISATPVAAADLKQATIPILIRAQAEGQAVA